MPNYGHMLLVYSCAIISPILYMYFYGRQFSQEQLKIPFNKKRLGRLFYGGFVMILTLIFNIAYTGIMGWNRMPQSGLEMVLDLITGVLLFVCYLFMHANRKAVQ
ncbi:hypothetical protein D3C85_684380 [compost metagenome]